MVEQIILYCFSFTEFANWFNNNQAFQDAVNASSLQLYIQHRDNFAIDQAATDYLQEMYNVYPQSVANPLVINQFPSAGVVLDVVKVIEVQYVANGAWYAVKFFSPNEWNLAITNPVTPPAIRRNGVYRQLVSNFTYDILPAGYIAARARCLQLPTVSEFTFTDNGTSVPDITVVTDLNWSPDKVPKLAFMTMMNYALTVNSDSLYKFAQAQSALTP